MNFADLLTIDRVAVGVEAEDWRDVVRQVGRLMVATGGVEERYIQGMIRTAEELGPYMVVAPGIAMPHSRPEDGVLEPCMALITLRAPIEFGNPENDPVRLAFAFGAVDNAQHVQALQQIATIFAQFYDNLGGIDELVDAKTPDELLVTMLGALSAAEGAAPN